MLPGPGPRPSCKSINNKATLPSPLIHSSPHLPTPFTPGSGSCTLLHTSPHSSHLDQGHVAGAQAQVDGDDASGAGSQRKGVLAGGVDVEQAAHPAQSHGQIQGLGDLQGDGVNLRGRGEEVEGGRKVSQRTSIDVGHISNLQITDMAYRLFNYGEVRLSAPHNSFP